MRASSAEASDNSRVQFATRFFAALRHRDAQRVRDLAKQAGDAKWPEAVRSLCDFLAPPSSRWNTPRRKRGWSEARAAAVWALGQIADPACHRALSRTLTCDPNFMVRTAAFAALETLGEATVPSLIEAVRDTIEWELDGMRLAIHRLGDSSRVSDDVARAANIALIDVLFENTPRPPRRWARAGRKFGRVAAIFVMIAVTFGLQQDGWSLLPALLMSWIPGQMAGFAAKMAASVLLGSVQGRAERNVLHAAVADSLVRLNDKRAIPGMLRLAFDSPLRDSGRHARAVLRRLLPQVSGEDISLFAAADIEIMNGALAPSVDAELLVGLLRALEAVGNRTSIRRVQRVAQRSRWGEVRMEADRVLQVLQAREAQAKLSQSLLRGAPSPNAAPAELLRASMPRSVDPPEQLLRATCNDSQE